MPMTNFERDFARMFPESAKTPDSLINAVACGNYSAVSKDDIESSMTKSEVVAGLISQLSEAYENGASPIVINDLVGVIAKVRKVIISDILNSRSYQEVA